MIWRNTYEENVHIICFLFILFLNIPIYANDEIVYIDKENIDSKYHRVTCSEIRPNRYTTISVEKAFAQGYRGCALCNPPQSDVEYNERLQHAKEIINSIPTTTIEPSDDTRTVYVTTDGAKFHSAGCDEMKSIPHALTITNAQNRGYAPCKVCNPYNLADTSNVEKKVNNINPLVYIICGLILLLVVYLIYNDKKYKK